jgi:hypothetical protein
MNLKNSLVAFFLICSLNIGAQNGANAVFDRNTVETGDTFILRVIVAARKEPGKVDFSPWRDLLPADNILSQSGWSRSSGKWVCRFTLIAFDSARLELPPLKVPLKVGDSVPTNPLVLTVKPTPAIADVSKAEAIRDIRREPVLWTDYWPWALGAVAFLALIMWLLRRKKPKPVAAIQAPPPPPAVPAHELALREINILEQQQIWKKGQVEPFYARLSLIVREYLERRFGIPALESTTREILPLLKTAGFPENLNSVLREVLHESDMTKFAKNPPPEHFHEKALNMARQIILATA